jgi:hypothetical protein
MFPLRWTIKRAIFSAWIGKTNLTVKMTDWLKRVRVTAIDEVQDDDESRGQRGWSYMAQVEFLCYFSRSTHLTDWEAEML